MNDTSPEMTRKMCEMIQKISPFERLMMGCSMYETSRYLILRSILENEPHISPTDLKKELFLKFYKDDFDLEQQEKILKHLRTYSKKQLMDMY